MTPLRTFTLLRALFVTFSATVGLLIGAETMGSALSGGAVGAAFGLVVVLADRLLDGISLRVFSSATFGLFIGFIFARLLLASNLLERSPEDLQWIAGLVAYATFGYLGMMLAMRSNRDEFSLIVPYVRFRQSTIQDEPLVVDSSVIIDGRLPELCATGFLSTSLVIPRFILDELQRLADSADPLKRDRGRIALERLEQMQRDPQLSITIHESEGASDLPVDTQLAQLAKRLNARLLTNDNGLGAIARLQNVSVLNLNDLVRVLRPVLEPGQQMELALVKEGREGHQAIGYLGDGTMIVVNHARQHIGKTVRVTIGSALQTSAGRLFFGELK
ncbi:MAG TPA: PIN domain-containing protein [Chthoniobacteraceae bacterium]|jgi:uncharacterized protein YacL